MERETGERRAVGGDEFDETLLWFGCGRDMHRRSGNCDEPLAIRRHRKTFDRFDSCNFLRFGPNQRFGYLLNSSINYLIYDENFFYVMAIRNDRNVMILIII